MPGLTELFGFDSRWCRCVHCGLPFQVPAWLYEWAMMHRKIIWCPGGHENNVHGDLGPSRMVERLENRNREIERLERQLAATRGQITKLKKQASRPRR